MRRRLAVLALLFAAPSANALDMVSLARPDGATLTAVVVKPRGKGPFPAVVALHGCGGLVIRNGDFAGRDKDWADRFTQAGFVAIFPDSFTARGYAKGVCTIRGRSVNARERGRDAAAAADWLAAQSFVDAKRIGLVGWSHGGSSALAAVSLSRPEKTDFRTAAIFYPGCRQFLGQGWKPRMKAVILHGIEDDWTDIAPCDNLAKESGVPIVRYPQAHHGFDAPDQPLRTRPAAYSKNDTGTVTLGTNDAARADAIRRVMRLLREM